MTSKLQILSLQHSVVDHPASWETALAEDGHSLTTVQVDQGEAFPDPRAFDMLWVMHGPQDITSENLPWLKAEQAIIRTAVDGGLAVIGLNLGAQLIASALGGEIKRLNGPQFGIGSVELSEAGRGDRLFSNLPEVFHTLHWHDAEISRPPPGSEVLAYTTGCPVQAFRTGRSVYGLQFHGEMNEQSVTDRLSDSGYRRRLEAVLGKAAIEDLAAVAHGYAAECAAIARLLYRNLMAIPQRSGVH